MESEGSGARVEVQPPQEVLSPAGPWGKVEPGGAQHRAQEGPPAALRSHQGKTGGAGPVAGAQWLHQAETLAENKAANATSWRSGRARSVLRWFSTAVLYAAFLGLGMSVAILGPTFQDLAANVNRNISGLFLMFVGRASGFLCGTMIGGVLFDHTNQFFLLGVSVVATAVGLYLIPFCKTAVLLMVTMSVFGASVGVVDTDFSKSNEKTFF